MCEVGGRDIVVRAWRMAPYKYGVRSEDGRYRTIMYARSRRYLRRYLEE